jgi:hypothetical protein
MMIHSWTEKELSRLGDGVSMALVNILSASDMKNKERVRDFLPLIRDAFANPQFISVEAHKKPTATLRLLDSLRQALDDPQVRQDIEKTAEFVKNRTKQ